MPRQAQGYGEKDGRSRKTAAVLFLVALGCASACSSRLGNPEAAVDRTVVTGSVPDQSAADEDPARAADIATIRDAVSSADVEAVKGATLAWANVDTGSRGGISGLTEYTDKGTVCRRFEASRESFDGVTMFKGDACAAGQGAWRMRAFDAL